MLREEEETHGRKDVSGRGDNKRNISCRELEQFCIGIREERGDSEY
jgi:hypothetical protein